MLIVKYTNVNFFKITKEKVLFMKGFAERLKYLREELGLTQKELAKVCNVSPQCICCLEQDTRNPTGSTVAVLARTLNTSADYLLGLEDDFGIRTATTTDDCLTSEEREIIKKYRELNIHGKKLVNTVIDTHLAAMAENKRNLNKNT